MKTAFSRAGHLARLFALTLPLLLAVPASADETLTYDANGNVETRTLPGGTTTYGYDDLNRVGSEAGPAKTQSLSYDPNDNRLTDGSGTKTYSPNSDRLLTDNGQNISLDAAGNTIQARGLTFTWNQAGQLKTVSQGTTLLATYYYDDRGRRTRKVREGGGSLSYRTTIYVHDLYDRLTSELNGTGNPQRTYVWRDDIPVAIIEHPGETVLYLETDHLNTPIAARNHAGTVVWKWESDAFGSTPANEDPDGNGMLTTINLRFPGQYYDKESGLHYNWHRVYDPRLGRYLSPDPIGLAGGANLYGYVEGNPLSRVDPTGEDWKGSLGITGATSAVKIFLKSPATEAGEACSASVDCYFANTPGGEARIVEMCTTWADKLPNPDIRAGSASGAFPECYSVCKKEIQKRCNQCPPSNSPSK